MTGPEHYREAERLLSEAGVGGAEGTYFVRPESLAAAQVHATLAAAAATALGSTRTGAMPAADYEAWRAAAGDEAAGR
jgi:hypothetical protein